jgi:AcrR family transcriptional regulator
MDMTLLAPRQSYHHGNLQEALILAAKKMVRDDGAEHLSLRAVAGEVGVSPSAAYHYFPDKDALISGVGQVLFDELADLQMQRIEQFPGDDAESARKRFRALGEAYFDWAVTEPNLFRLMFGAFCSIEEDDGSQLAREESPAWKLLQKGLDDLLSAGALNPAMRPYGEILSWSAVHGACALIIEGHLPKEAFGSVLDALYLSLGVSETPASPSKKGVKK